MIDITKLNEMLTLAEKATPGPWWWEDDYDFREHLDHKKLGLDADCENVRNDAKRVNLESPTGSVLSEWSEQGTADAGILISTNDARFIERCSPQTIIALIEEIKMRRSRFPH